MRYLFQNNYLMPIWVVLRKAAALKAAGIWHAVSSCAAFRCAAFHGTELLCTTGGPLTEATLAFCRRPVCPLPNMVSGILSVPRALPLPFPMPRPFLPRDASQTFFA